MPRQNQVPSAETTALKALAYLGESEDPFGRFIDQTGLSPDSMRARIAEPDFLAAILEFLLTDDSLLMGFCEQEGLQPKDVYAAKRALSGHD